MASGHSQYIFCGTGLFHSYLGVAFHTHSMDCVIEFGVFWASLSLAQTSYVKGGFSDGFSVSKVLEDLLRVFVMELYQCISQSLQVVSAPLWGCLLGSQTFTVCLIPFLLSFFECD